MIARILTAAALGLTLLANAIAEPQAAKGPNGGIVVRVEDHPIEFVVREQEILFYIGDHDGKLMSTKGVKGRAVVQDGGKTFTVPLSAAPPNLLVGKLPRPLGPKARVVFSSVIDGHNLQARFVAP